MPATDECLAAWGPIFVLSDLSARATRPVMTPLARDRVRDRFMTFA
jgi:hypothetical protein